MSTARQMMDAVMKALRSEHRKGKEGAKLCKAKSVQKAVKAYNEKSGYTISPKQLQGYAKMVCAGKKSVRKSGKKSAKKSAKKSVKKSLRKSRKAAKKSAKKSVGKKSAKKSAKKSVRKSAKKSGRKSRARK